MEPALSPASPPPPRPPLRERFRIAGASVLGHEHRRLERGNQDALSWYAGDRALVAAVADGCGSSRHSEVGARLGVRLLVAALTRHLSGAPGEGVPGAGEPALGPALVERARDDMLAHLRVTAQAMGGDLAQVVSDYFLFTLVGAVITPARALVFAMGDGVIAVNGAPRVLGPFPDNCPPYPAYALLPGRRGLDPAGGLAIPAELPTERLDSLLLATDGAADLIARAEAPLPGRDEPAGALSQFWTDDRYHDNPDAIRRRLWLMNRDHPRPDWDRRRLVRRAGLLPDDTSLISIRRAGGTRS